MLTQYTAPVASEALKTKRIEDLDELEQLRELKRRQNNESKKIQVNKAPEAKGKKIMNEYNNFLTRQVETNKMIFRERSCWKRYLCCCMYPEPETEEGYLQLY